MKISAVIKASIKNAFDSISEELDDKLAEAVKAGIAIGVEAGAEAALKAIEAEKTKKRHERFDRRYHNTKLLLKNYKYLNEHFKSAIFTSGQLKESDESFYEIMEIMSGQSGDEQVYVDSIKESAHKTKIIMAHVNRMLEAYKAICETSPKEEERRHYRILKALYLEDITYSAAEIAARECVDKRTVYRDIDTAVTNLTALLYGMGGLEIK